MNRQYRGWGSRGHPIRTTRKKIQKNNDSLRNLWNNVKYNNICIIGVPEGEEREQEIENLFEELMMENYSNLVKEIDIQPQEVQRVPKRLTPRHIIIKMPKVKFKERILKK